MKGRSRHWDDSNPLRGGRWLGKKLPLMGELTAKAGEKFIDWNNARLKRRAERMARAEAVVVDQMADRLYAKRLADREASTRSALDEAESLKEISERTGTSGAAWEAALRRARMSARTADNLLALWDFRARRPELFDLLATLGRTKLYHLARVPAAKLAHLRPESKVRMGEVTKTLEELTERELLAYLREVCPVKQRKRAPNLRRHVLAALEIASDGAKIGRISRPELEANVARVQELFGTLKNRLKNSA